MNITELDNMTMHELQDLARDMAISGYSRLKKQELIFRLLEAQTEQAGQIFRAGVLEVVSEGFGFLRGPRLLPSSDDIYVSQSQIRRFGLRTGDLVSGRVRPPKESERYFSLLKVEAVNLMT
jgi:transcription termination factor Rho